LPVAYWFGYGRSYTTFDYRDISVLCDGVTAGGRLNVEVTVQNTGSVAGTEVVQAYIGYPNTAVERPDKELKAFARVTLEPGESETVQFQIPAADFAYFDATSNDWIVEAVPHEVIIAASANPNDSNHLVAAFTVD
jgi:beta-glucosidase